MKKILLTTCALVLGLASCTQKEITPITPTGEEVSVSFSAAIPGTEAATRAYSDGSTAKILTYYVYDEDTTPATLLTTVSGTATFNTDLKANVELRLVSGKSYSVVFWADKYGLMKADKTPNTDNPYSYSTKDKAITIDYNGIEAQDENRDAFFAYRESFTVTNTINEPITLRRPFAQINVGTSDYDDAKDAGLLVDRSSMTVSGIYSTIDLSNGELSGQTDVTFTTAAIPGEGETFPVEANPAYKYLGMNYVLVAAEKTVIDVKFTCGAESREIPEMTFASVPVQRNYRTNIYGALITDPVNFNVSIDPEYETPDHDIQLNTALNETSGEKYTSLQAAIDAADAEDVIRVWGTMDEDIVLNKDLTIIGGSDEVTVRAAAAAAPGAKIRTLNVANNVTAAFENLQFFGAKNITNSPTSVLVNNVKDVIFKNCVFAQENVTEPGMRPIETAYGLTGKLTLEGCTVRPGTSNAYFNALGTAGELTLTGNTFEQVVTIDPLISADQASGKFTIENNSFDFVAFTSVTGARSEAELTDIEKAYANMLISNNSFADEAKKVKVFCNDWTTTFFINGLNPVITNITTGESYETVTAALDAAKAGETVSANGVECAEDITVPADVTLDGFGNSTFTGKISVNAGGKLCNFTSQWAGNTNRQAIAVMGSNVTVNNLTIEYKGDLKKSEAVVTWAGAENFTITNCQFSGYWKGMYLNSTKGLVIEGCTFNSMNPFSTDEWDASMRVKGNTFLKNGPTSKASQIVLPDGSEGMEGTTKYQESWPRPLQESIYGILTENTFENTPYIRVSYGPAGNFTWDYNSMYFSVNSFYKGEIKNNPNNSSRDRQLPSEWDFGTHNGKSNVLHYVLNEKTNQANRENKTHFYNTQGLSFPVFNPEKLTKWEVSGEIYVDEAMIAAKTPFRSELWTSAKTMAEEQAYPMMGIANVEEDAGGIYQSTMDHAVVRIWGENGWSIVEGAEVTAGWHKVKMVSNGTDVTYYFDDAVVGKYNSAAYLISVMPEAFHYDYTHTDGRKFYPGYTCDTYFYNVRYTLTK